LSLWPTFELLGGGGGVTPPHTPYSDVFDYSPRKEKLLLNFPKWHINGVLQLKL
jgi:hypothetical protein